MKKPLGLSVFAPLMLVTALGLFFVGVGVHADSSKGKGKDDDDQKEKGGNSSGAAYVISLSGNEEVPAILTTGEGTVSLKVDGTTVTYELEYSNLKNGAAATASHIHLAQKGVSGPVAAFLCGGGGKPTCPVPGTKLTGTIVASDIQAIAAQGLAAGDLTAFLSALRGGLLYANLHSAAFPGGEIRGQLSHGRSKD